MMDTVVLLHETLDEEPEKDEKCKKVGSVGTERLLGGERGDREGLVLSWPRAHQHDSYTPHLSQSYLIPPRVNNKHTVTIAVLLGKYVFRHLAS
jgi:hypothetical protein